MIKKCFKAYGDEVFGVEIHYIVKVFKENKGMQCATSSGETAVMIAYKVAIHIMKGDLDDYPIEDESDIVELRNYTL